MAATTQIICKLTDTAAGTVVFESDVTEQVNGIIVPAGKVEANKTYKLELFQNTPDNASDFKLQIAGTFSTTAWKVEYPTTIPWASITGAPKLDNILTKAELKNLATKEDLKNKVGILELDEIKNEIKTLKAGGAGGGTGGAATIDPEEIKNIVKEIAYIKEETDNAIKNYAYNKQQVDDKIAAITPGLSDTQVETKVKEITYDKETLNRKFTEVSGLANGDQYVTLKKLREWLKPAGVVIPIVREEFAELGFKGHSTINLTFALTRGGDYGPAIRGIVIELEKLGEIFVKYANITAGSFNKDKFDVIMSTYNYSMSTVAPITPIPAGFTPDGMSEFKGTVIGNGTYDNGYYYLPYLPLLKESNNPVPNYLYFLGTTFKTTYSLVLTCPDRVKSVRAIAGVDGRWSNKISLSISYDSTKVMENEGKIFGNYASTATWTVNNPE